MYDEGGTLVTTFRVAEDGSYADQEDEAFAVPSAKSVGIVHVIELDPQTAADWGDVLSDYEILQPFPQLGRPVYRLEAAERQAMKWVHQPKQAVPLGRMLGLVNRGWERGVPQDAGVVHDMLYPLPDGVHEVRMLLGGGRIWAGYIEGQEEDPTVEAILVCRRGDWSDTPCMPPR